MEDKRCIVWPGKYSWEDVFKIEYISKETPKRYYYMDTRWEDRECYVEKWRDVFEFPSMAVAKTALEEVRAQHDELIEERAKEAAAAKAAAREAERAVHEERRRRLRALEDRAETIAVKPVVD